MYPILFEIPLIGWKIPGYGFMLMIGFLVAILWAARRAARSGGNPDVILNCGFVCLFAGIVGCRAMYVIHYWDQFASRGNWLSVLISIVDVRQGGMEFYGGFLLSIASVVAWLRWVEKVSLRWYFDIIAPSSAIGLAIGRVGCLLNGCCYGGTCDFPWAITFPPASPAAADHWEHKLQGAGLPAELLYTHSVGLTLPLERDSLAASEAQLLNAEKAERDAREAARQAREALDRASGDEKRRLQREVARADERVRNAALLYGDVRNNMERFGLSAAQMRELAAQHRSLPVHPAQVYSTITATLLALLLSALYWRRTRDGQVICALLILEPMSRWLIEVIRDDNPHDALFGFTISQQLAVGMTLFGALALLALRLLPPRSPRAQIWTAPPDDVRTGARSAAAAGAGLSASAASAATSIARRGAGKR